MCLCSLFIVQTTSLLCVSVLLSTWRGWDIAGWSVQVLLNVFPHTDVWSFDVFEWISQAMNISSESSRQPKLKRKQHWPKTSFSACVCLEIACLCFNDRVNMLSNAWLTCSSFPRHDILYNIISKLIYFIKLNLRTVSTVFCSPDFGSLNLYTWQAMIILGWFG